MSNNNNTNKPSKTTAQGLDSMAIAGIKKYFANVTKITMGGADYSAAAMTATLQAEIDAIVALEAGKAQLKQQVADTRTVRANARTLRSRIRKYILATYGAEAVQMLGDFGMKEPKLPGPKTTEAKAQAAAKAAATRKARREAAKNAVAAKAPASAVTTPAK